MKKLLIPIVLLLCSCSDYVDHASVGMVVKNQEGCWCEVDITDTDKEVITYWIPCPDSTEVGSSVNLVIEQK
jgi:hypothetical protein